MTGDPQFKALRETVQQHMKEQKAENAYIHKRIDEMHSYVKEFLEISRMHRRTPLGDFNMPPLVEMEKSFVPATEQCTAQTFGGMFCTAIPETQFQGEEEEGIPQKQSTCTLSRGKGVEHAAEKCNGKKATSPLEALLRASELGDHGGSGDASPAKKKRKDHMAVDMDTCGINEEECELDTQKRVSKRRIVHTEKGAEMAGNKKQIGKRPTPKKMAIATHPSQV